MNKDFRKLTKAAEDRGWKLTKGSKHYVLEHPSGRRVIVADTASCHRALKNLDADIRRAERAAA